MLSKFFKKIEDQAPLIGGILELGAPPAVKKVMEIMNTALGTKNESEMLHVLQTDPDAFLKLKQAEMQNEIALKAIMLDETRAYLLDIQSARQREVEFIKATGHRDWFQVTIGIMVLSGFIGALIASFTLPLPNGSDRIVGALIGILGTLTIQVVHYLFGSSKSSADKTAIITQMKKENNV